MEESLSSPITFPPTSPCMPPFTPCYVQEPLDSASSFVESDCDNSILDDSLASSNHSDFSHMQDELDKICDLQLQTSLSSSTVNESELQSSEGGMSVNVIPDEEDYKYLKSDFAVLITQMIVEYIPFFNEDYEGLPLKHISHIFSKQMSSSMGGKYNFFFLSFCYISGPSRCFTQE